MASLLSDSDKNTLNNIISTEMFDTFKSTITVWKRAQRTIISTNPNYNFLTDAYEKESIENVTITQTFEAIILYLKPEDIKSYLAGQGRLDERVNTDTVIVRIKCKEDLFNYLKDSEAIEFDGKKFKQSSGTKQYGLFSRNMYQLFLEELK